MMIDFNVNQLLAEVKIRKLLWDVNDEFYGNRVETTNAWAEICRTFFPDFDKKNSKAKRTTEDFVKNKWKNARDEFVKRLKAGLIGHGGYKYEEELMFLHEMYCNKLQLPVHKSSVVKKSKKQTNNVQTSRRNLRSKTTVSYEEPTVAPGEMNISVRSASPPAPKRLQVNQNEAISAEENLTVVEPSSSAGISCRITRSTARRSSKRLQSMRNEAVSSEGNDTVEATVGSADKNTSPNASKRIRLHLIKTVPSKEPGTTEEPNSSVGIVAKNTIRRVSKRVESSQNELIPAEENYIVEEPSTSPIETDDAPSMETENENMESNNAVTLAQHQAKKRSQNFQSSHSSNYVSIISFSSQGEVDEDMAFFKTLLTWIKKFDENERLEFRTEVMNLLWKIRNHETITNSCMISPSST